MCSFSLSSSFQALTTRPGRPYLEIVVLLVLVIVKTVLTADGRVMLMVRPSQMVSSVLAAKYVWMAMGISVRIHTGWSFSVAVALTARL